MASYCTCPCGNEFEILVYGAVESFFLPLSIVNQLVADIKSGTLPLAGPEAADNLTDIIREPETYVYICPECNRIIIHPCLYFGSHVFEKEKPRSEMFLHHHPQEGVPQGENTALVHYHCLCGTTFAADALHHEHCYAFLSKPLEMEFGDIIEESSITPAELLYILAAKLLYCVICPHCGRIGLEQGDSVRIYRYEGKMKDLRCVWWRYPEIVRNLDQSLTYCFPESDPPDADPWEPLRQEYAALEAAEAAEAAAKKGQ